MARLLTPEEWRIQKVPMAFTRITYSSWTDTHYELAEKWILDHCEGWVWFNRRDKVFVFGLQSDAAFFDLWLEEGIVERERGHIAAKDAE